MNEVICGDSLEIMRGYKDKQFDLVLTDIPYNISQKHGGLREIDYGEWDKGITLDTVVKWTDEMIRVSKNGVYIFCADQQFSTVFNRCEEKGLIAKQLKRNATGIDISEKYCEIARNRLKQEMLF